MAMGSLDRKFYKHKVKEKIGYFFLGFGKNFPLGMGLKFCIQPISYPQKISE